MRFALTKSWPKGGTGGRSVEMGEFGRRLQPAVLLTRGRDQRFRNALALPGGQEVGGSNPPGPTSKEPGHRCFSLFGTIAQTLLALRKVEEKLKCDGVGGLRCLRMRRRAAHSTVDDSFHTL